MSKLHQCNKNVLVFVEERTSRIEYTFDFVFRCVLKLNITWVSDVTLFEEGKLPKINYSFREFSSTCISFQPHLLLMEKGIRREGEFSLDYSGGKPYIKQSNQHNCPFATIFFFLSRYEEYWDFHEDIHNRFTHEVSLSKSMGSIHIPVVDVWINWLRVELNKVFRIKIERPDTSFLSTFDIDHVRAFQWKGITRSAGALGKEIIRGQWEVIAKRLDTWMRKGKDPFDVFEYLNDIHKKYNSDLIYFWLLGSYNEYDKNPSPRNGNFQKEIKKHSDRFPVGIHPSYLSFLNEERMKTEIDTLSTISQKRIFRSRFHFLRYKLPESYQQLIRLGIEEDYSMGYPDRLGFRAGTSHPFLWYDLSQDKATNLVIYPFQVMDVTLKNYIQMKPSEALDISLHIIKQIQKYGGTFTLLWHNSSFEKTEWGDWIGVFEKILEEGTTLLQQPSPEQSS